MSALLSLEEAQERLLALAMPLAPEILPASEAVGRYLAADLVAQRTQPAADLSAMDGYALGANDLAGPWQVVGESAAGHPFAGSLSPGEAARISTGAMLPTGSGAVLLQENATRDGNLLALANADGPTPRHIRRAGFDFASGDVLLPAGTKVGPAQLALALSAGHAALSVHGLPGLAVIDSGDELSADPTDCAPHQIPASNGPAIAALAAPYAGRITRIGPVADKLDDVIAALEQASGAQVIVTSGGASVGDHDLIKPALEAWGASLDFWRVAIRPGKPVMVARRGSTIVLGLPGNPVSSYVTAVLFLLPLLRRMGGARNPMAQAFLVPAAGELPPGGSRTEFVRARIEHGHVVPIAERDSSALRAMASAEALIRRDIDAPAVTAGDLVPVYPIQNGGIA